MRGSGRLRIAQEAHGDIGWGTCRGQPGPENAGVLDRRNAQPVVFAHLKGKTPAQKAGAIPQALASPRDAKSILQI